MLFFKEKEAALNYVLLNKGILIDRNFFKERTQRAIIKGLLGDDFG